MGYEIAGGIGAKRAAPERDIIVMVGDGSYLMMHTELVTAVAEGIKVIVVLIQNDGFASIGALSDTVGSGRYGTRYRFRDDEHNSFDTGDRVPVDLAANAESLGVRVIRVEPGADAIGQLGEAVRQAKAVEGPTLIHINSDPMLFAPDSESWWDVPVAEVSTLESTRHAREAYESQRAAQRPLL
jgi:3D-(3,5/4)-trihydroxycyclohexane-1,2-dione acylhydrolase (decyclizing)